MRTVAHRARRQRARQRRAAARRDFERRWREMGGIDGYLQLMYPDEACEDLMTAALNLGKGYGRLLELKGPRGCSVI